jgi:DnaK suppressor protein
MYNPALFWIRQESQMVAKKTRKKAPASRKKATARKSKAKKRAVSRRKVTRKKATAKKPVSRRKAAKKKPASGKKKSTRKKVTRKKAASKKATLKKPGKKKRGKKKAARKTAPKKRVVRKKPVSRKRAATKKSARKTSVRRRRSTQELLSGPIHGINPYKPRRGEQYMSAGQLEHFREILSAWKRELMFEVDRTVHHMQDEAANFPDPNDRATQESEFGLELRTRDRERKLLRKIDSALARIDDGSYGYCEETGEEIGLKRLEARPVATLCLEAQERRELAERQFRDRDDRYR